MKENKALENQTGSSYDDLVLDLYLPLAGGALAVRIYGLKVLGILLLFDLKRSPRYQGRAKPLR